MSCSNTSIHNSGVQRVLSIPVFSLQAGQSQKMATSSKLNDDVTKKSDKKHICDRSRTTQRAVITVDGALTHGGQHERHEFPDSDNERDKDFIYDGPRLFSLSEGLQLQRCRIFRLYILTFHRKTSQKAWIRIVCRPCYLKFLSHRFTLNKYLKTSTAAIKFKQCHLQGTA